MNHEEKFKDALLCLAELLCAIIEESSDKGFKEINLDLLDPAIGMLKNYKSDKMVQAFIKQSHRMLNEFYDRMETSLIANLHVIFANPKVPKSLIQSVKNLYESKDRDNNRYISLDDRNEIWDYIDSLILYSLEHYASSDRTRLILNRDMDSNFNVEKELERWRSKLGKSN